MPASTPAPGSTALDRDLGWALGAVFRAYLRSGSAAVADLPGGPRGYLVLASAGRDLPSSQQALGQRLGIDRSVMTYLIDDLAASGLVERQADPADRRARHVVLTAAGRARLAELEQRLLLVEEHVLGVLDADERATFRTLVRRVAQNADLLDPVVSECDVVQDLAELDPATGAVVAGTRRATGRRS